MKEVSTRRINFIFKFHFGLFVSRENNIRIFMRSYNSLQENSSIRSFHFLSVETQPSYVQTILAIFIRSRFFFYKAHFFVT